VNKTSSSESVATTTSVPVTNIVPYKTNNKTRKNVKERSKIAVLGEGAFGRVNKEKLKSGLVVATKYLLDKKTLQENINEIATLKYLQGKPHVSQFIGSNSENTKGKCTVFPCIIMEKAKNNLESIKYTSWDQLLKTVIGVLKGFDVLHSSNIAHRDTKPRNMLMSMKDEVLITDFGTSRYLPPQLPPCQDKYTGTIWYSSPEVLLKSVMKGVTFSREGWFANDAWAVGTSIYHILTGTPLFTHADAAGHFDEMKDNPLQRETRLYVLLNIYAKLGIPVEGDGELYELNKKYTDSHEKSLFSRVQEIYPAVKPTRLPDAVYNRVLNRSNFKTANEKQLKLVASIVNRLLDYNPKTRLTIRGALKILLKEGLITTDELSKPDEQDLFEEYTLPVSMLMESSSSSASSSASISKITAADIKEVFRWMTTLTLSLSSNTVQFVFDRTFIIFNAALRHLGSSMTKYSLRPFLLACICISSAMFDSSGYGLSLKEVSVFGSKEDTIYKYINLIMLANVQIFGITYFDILISTIDPKRAIDINLTCHVNSLYSEFSMKATPSEIMEYLIEFGKGSEVINGSNLVSGFDKSIAY